MLTLDEINAQPDKLLTVGERFSELTKEALDFLKGTDFSEIDFVGCGTSYNLAMGVSMQFNRIRKKKEPVSNFFSGSEVAFGLRDIDKDAVVVGISRSGESTETVLAMRRCKEAGIKTIGITCESDSSITKVCDVNVVLDFVNEKSVVMTQSFTAMAFVASALVRKLLGDSTLQGYLQIIPESCESVLEESQKVIERLNIKAYEHFVFLGYEEYYAAALEGVTKVMETSLCEVDAFQTMEYRHGPKSKVTQKTLALILSNSMLKEEEEKMASEIEKLGGKAVNVSDKQMNNILNVIVPYNSDDFGDWFLRVIPMQILGVKKAISKGLNPDEPKNLTKVVKL